MEEFFTQLQTRKLRHFHDFFVLNFIVIVRKGFKGAQDVPKFFLKTAEEAVEYLFSEELESEMIILTPEVDELTDEEGFDDTETLDPSVRDVICPIIFS
ncbi:uncharacterized protein NPIL_523661 [Nephila pilipes]|uniref:Uncharacterized protein n=1 Tax=Nephila pilipes TaxID=299642 RepID=A0A8X6PJB8_NEPPI|nr:uncharacterized protein NPIL_523661 [Nephila pilipes]